MKKRIITLFICFFLTGIAQAETVTVDGPWSPTGSYQKIIRLITADMEKNGWQFSTKITGNPLLSKTSAESAKSLYVLAWATEANTKKSDAFYVGVPNSKNYIGMTHIANQFLCGAKGLTLKDLENKKKTYKIGVGVVDTIPVNWLNDFMSYLGVKHTLIKYQGSSKSSNALLSGEVDFVLNSAGAKMHKQGQVNCLVVPSDQSFLGIPTVKSKYPKFNQPVMYNAMYFQAYNFNQKQLDKFRSDFKKALKNKELETLLSSRYAGKVNISMDDQIKIIKFYDSRLGK